MTVETMWVLVMMTALNRYDFVTENIGTYDTMAECYVASTEIFWENVPVNKEAVCIRVEENRVAKD